MATKPRAARQPGKLKGFSFPCMVASLALLASVAYAESPPRVMKLTSDGSGAEPLREFSTANLKIRARTYENSEGGIVGYSWVEGPQYKLVTPQRAEVLHVIDGNGSYVDQDGRLFPLKAGDVLFVQSGMPHTTRDSTSYSHHYVVFPLELPSDPNRPQIRQLRFSEIKEQDFQPATNGGREHIYYHGQNGVTVVAWRAPEKGAIKGATRNRWLAVVGGSGEFTENGGAISVKPGDTLLLRKGASYTWKASDLQSIYVDFE